MLGAFHSECTIQSIMLSGIMLSVFMLNVVVLNVVAPFKVGRNEVFFLR